MLKQIFLLTLVISVTNHVHADSYSFIDRCMKSAIKSFEREADGKGAKLDVDTVHVTGIDDRWYNPSKYVWFQAEATTENGEKIILKDMKQYSAKTFKKCKKPDEFKAPKDKKYIAECRKAAIRKLKHKAKAQGAKLREDTVDVDEIDDRWYNPSKYVWFKADAVKENGSVIKLVAMTQKSFLPKNRCGNYSKPSKDSGRTTKQRGSEANR